MLKPPKRGQPLSFTNDDRISLYLALNMPSPTGYFRDSYGYTLLQRRTYEAQNRAAAEIDQKLRQKTPTN